MTLNYALADKMANVSDVKRHDMAQSGRFSASTDTQSADKPKESGNVVEAEMKSQETESRFSPVFEQLHEAVSAAAEACQKLTEGVQSEKEQDKKLATVLDDLITVVGNIRDTRSDIMSQIAPAQDAPEPLKS